MSDVLSESTVDCYTLQDVACSDRCAITVTMSFDKLPMTHKIERQKVKHINWNLKMRLATLSNPIGNAAA